MTNNGFLNSPCNAALRKISMKRGKLTDDLFRCALVTFPNTKCFEILGCAEESELNLAAILFSNPDLIVKCGGRFWGHNTIPQGKFYAHPKLELGEIVKFCDENDLLKTVDKHLVVVNFGQPNLPDQEDNLTTKLSFDNNYNQANVSEVLSRNESKHLVSLVLFSKSIALLPKFDSWRMDNLTLRSCNSNTNLLSQFARKAIVIDVDQLHLEWTRLSDELLATLFSN
jgi:hypothetical protein